MPRQLRQAFFATFLAKTPDSREIDNVVGSSAASSASGLAANYNASASRRPDKLRCITDEVSSRVRVGRKHGW